MPRPTNKSALIALSHENYHKLWTLINCFEENEKINGTIPFEDRDKNLRDIITHLHHWHLLFIEWYNVGMAGKKPDMPKKGYTWKTLPDLNHWIWSQYQNTDFYAAKALLDNSFTHVQTLIEQHNDEELFTKKHYHWTGTTSLGSYLISATSSHYDWAIKKVRKYQRELKKVKNK